MSIHYKFKSALEYDTVTFDSLHISVRDLKKAILLQKRIGKNIDFDLQVTNAQTKEVYTDDNALIAKNTSLIIARIPLTAQQKKAWDRSESNLLRDNSGKGGDLDGQDPSLHRHAKTLDLSSLDASEEDKILAMMSQSTQDYSPSNYMKIRGANQMGDVPTNYRCYKCHQPGHWIKNCPIGANVEPIEIKKSTGIPRSFMVPVDGPQVVGAMMTPSGTFAVPAVDHQAYKEGKKERPPFQPQPEQEVVKPEIPEDLVCSVCKDLLTDAVMIPCCGNSFCDECARTVLIESEEHECPDCREKDVSPDTLIPNRFLRNAVNNFRNATGYNNSRHSRPPSARTHHPPPLGAAQQAPEPILAREEIANQSDQAVPPGQPIATLLEGSRPLERRHRDSHLRDGMDGHKGGHGPPPPGVGMVHPPHLGPPFPGPPMGMQPLPPHVHQGYPPQAPGPLIRRSIEERPGTPTVDERSTALDALPDTSVPPPNCQPPPIYRPILPLPPPQQQQPPQYALQPPVQQPMLRPFGPRMPIFEPHMPFRHDPNAISNPYPDMDAGRGGYRGGYRGRGRGYQSAPYRGSHTQPSSGRPGLYIPSKPGGIDDPMAIFERMLREKDARDRRRRAATRRSRSRSYTRSRSRSRSYSPRSRSRSPPPPMRKRERERSRSRSFTISRSRSRSYTRSPLHRPRSPPPRDYSPPPRRPEHPPPRYRSPVPPPHRSPTRYLPPRRGSRDGYDYPGEPDYDSRDRPGRSGRDRFSERVVDSRKDKDYYNKPVTASARFPADPAPRYSPREAPYERYDVNPPRPYEEPPPPVQQRPYDPYRRFDAFDEAPPGTGPDLPIPSVATRYDRGPGGFQRVYDNLTPPGEEWEAESIPPPVKRDYYSPEVKKRRGPSKSPVRRSSRDRERERERFEEEDRHRKEEKRVKVSGKENVKEIVEESKVKEKEKEPSMDKEKKKEEKKLKEKRKKRKEKDAEEKRKRKRKERKEGKKDVAEKKKEKHVKEVIAEGTEKTIGMVDVPTKIVVKEVSTEPVEAPPGESLYDEMDDAGIDDGVMATYGKTPEDKQPPAVLAPLPELSKWELEEEFLSPGDKTKVDVNTADAASKVVTSEVLKRAENAIFQKAINAIRPLDGVKKSEGERKEGGAERKERKAYEEAERKEKKMHDESERKERKVHEEAEKKERKVHEDAERKERKTHEDRIAYEDAERKDRKLHEDSERKDRKAAFEDAERKDRESDRKERKTYDDSERKDVRKLYDEPDLAAKSMDADHREARKVANSIQITIPVEIPSLINMPLIVPPNTKTNKIKLDRSKFSNANWTKADQGTPSPRRVSAKDRLGARVDDPRRKLEQHRSRSRSPHRKIVYEQQLRKHEDRRYERMLDRYEEERRHEEMRRQQQQQQQQQEEGERRHRQHSGGSRREGRRSVSPRREERKEEKKKTTKAHKKGEGKVVRKKSTSDREAKKEKKKERKHKKEKKKVKEDEGVKEETKKTVEEKEVAANPIRNGDDVETKVTEEEVVKKVQRKTPKKVTLDEANFEPDYDLSEAESESEVTKKEATPPKESAKKRSRSESESTDDDSSDESSSSDDSSNASTKKRKRKHRKHKRKKAKNSSSGSQSDSDSDDSSSESGGRRKKSRKHKRSKTKVNKKKKKSKHR